MHQGLQKARYMYNRKCQILLKGFGNNFASFISWGYSFSQSEIVSKDYCYGRKTETQDLRVSWLKLRPGYSPRRQFVYQTQFNEASLVILLSYKI